jgi:hypothetical protein
LDRLRKAAAMTDLQTLLLFPSVVEENRFRVHGGFVEFQVQNLLNAKRVIKLL